MLGIKLNNCTTQPECFTVGTLLCLNPHNPTLTRFANSIQTSYLSIAPSLPSLHPQLCHSSLWIHPWTKVDHPNERGWDYAYHSADEGLVRIQYMCLVPIYVFPEMKLRGLVFPKQNFNALSLNFNINVSVRDLYISTIGLPRTDPGKYIKRSQI